MVLIVASGRAAAVLAPVEPAEVQDRRRPVGDRRGAPVGGVVVARNAALGVVLCVAFSRWGLPAGYLESRFANLGHNGSGCVDEEEYNSNENGGCEC